MLPAATAIASIEGIFRDCFRSFAALPNGTIIETPHVFGVVNDVPHPFFNGIGFSQLPDDAEPAVDEIVALYRQRQRPFRWWIAPSTRPRALEQLLRRRGFRHVYDSAGMAADLRAVQLDQPPPQELAIHVVSDRTRLQTWADILLTVFARPPEEIPVWIDAYSHLGLGSGPWRHYVGYAGEHAVATASVLLAGDLAGVYHVATLPDWRGRGFGAAVTLETMRHARSEGVSRIVLQSSEMGSGVYRSLGFRKYCDLTLYDWRPSPQ